MSPWVALFLGLAVGFGGAALLMNSNACCASLGKAGLAKYGLPDLGAGVDSFIGGLASSTGLV